MTMLRVGTTRRALLFQSQKFLHASKAISQARNQSSTGTSTLSTDFDAAPGDLSCSGQPYRAIFGSKSAQKALGSLSRASSISKMLVIRDGDAGAAQRTRYAEFLLMQAGIPCFQYTLTRDCATLETVDQAMETAQRVGANGVLAFGGGATMDLARAVSLFLPNAHLAESTAELMKKDTSSSKIATPLPHILMPTKSGAGVELSTRALVLDEEQEVKRALQPSVAIKAEGVIIDPTLAVTVPLQETVLGALTALGQCMESYLLGCGSKGADEVALEGVEIIANAFADPLVEGKLNLKDTSKREQFALGSVVSSISGNASGAGAAQCLAIGMGGISDLPHAQITSAFLPLIFDRYYSLAKENQGDEAFDEVDTKLAHLNAALASSSGFQANSIADWLRYVSKRFDLPDTKEFELESDGLVGVVIENANEHQQITHPEGGEDPIFEQEDYQSVLDLALAK